MSNVYVYSDTQVLNATFQQVITSVPLTDNDKTLAKYVMANVRTAPRMVLIGVKTFPEPNHLMNVVVKLPTVLGRVHASINEVHLQDPRALIATITDIPEAEGGGLLLIGVRDGQTVNAEKYNT